MGAAVSIVLPTLNEAKLLGATLAQFPPELRRMLGLELIVSDGGSTDDTLAIAATGADRVVRHDGGSRQTIGAGRNAGAKAATGDVLIFLDADARLPDPARFIRTMAEQLDRPGVSAATCPVHIAPAERILSDRIFHPLNNGYIQLMNRLGFGMGRGECQALRRERFNDLGGYDEKLVAGEDYDLFRRARKLGRIAFARDLVVYESPRRYRQLGYPKVVATWCLNTLAIVWLRRPVSTEWTPIR